MKFDGSEDNILVVIMDHCDKVNCTHLIQVSVEAYIGTVIIPSHLF